MNEPIVFKRSVLIGQLVLIQLLVPPLVAIGTLYALTVLYGVRFDGEFRTLCRAGRDPRAHGHEAAAAQHADDPAALGIDRR